MNDRARGETERFLSLLLEKNKRLNLTAIRDPEEAAVRHIGDVAAICGLFPFEGKRLIDVGSGGGVPGIPLRLICPSLRVTLLDAAAKKVTFLQSVCDTMGLGDVACIAARAEEQALLPGFRDAYDVAIARGVARLSILSELCLPFVRPGGFFLAMKGEDPRGETEEAATILARVGGCLKEVIPYDLGLNIRHTLVVVEKTRTTPPGYPRKWAIIKSETKREST